MYELITGMIASELEEKTISAGEQVNDIEERCMARPGRTEQLQADFRDNAGAVDTF